MMQAGKKNGTRVYVVRDGHSLRWPNGQHRGLGGYAVLRDDPTVAAYFRRGEPSNMRPAAEGEDAFPEPASKWPQAFRSQAPEALRDPEYLAEVEAKRAAAKAQADAKEEREQRSTKRRKKAAQGVPEPDEPIGKADPFQ